MGDFVGQGVPDDDALPDSPGTGEDVPTDDDAADDIGDSQADDVTDDDIDDGSDDVSDGDDDGTGDEGASPTFEKLLAKYGGNKEAFAQAYLDQANSMSDLTGQVKEIQEFIKGQKEEATVKISPEDLKQRIAEASDVVEASEELASIEAEYKDEEQAFKAYVADVGKAEKLVERIQGKLEVAFDENKPQYQAELANAQAKHERALDKFKSADRNLKKLSATFKRGQRQLEKAEKAAKAEVDREVRQQRGAVNEEQQTRTEFATAMLGVAQEHKLDPKSKEFKILFDSTQSRLWAYTQTLPEDADPINIETAVKAITNEYFEHGFGTGTFQGKSTQKRRTATTGKGKPTSDTATRTSKGKEPVRDSAWWDRRAARMLGG